MRKYVFSMLFLAFCLHAAAQVMMPGNSQHVKIDDVVALYKQMHPGFGQPDFARLLLPGLPSEENEKDYQFKRWLWYWQQHTDNNGYLVSPAKTWQEWQKAQQAAAGARTTSGVASSWTFAGPDSSDAYANNFGDGIGRINTISFHPTDSNTYWIGTPGGGAWKTTDNGATWTNMTAGLPVLAVSAIVFNPLNPNTIYLCSGDRDAGDYAGVGVLKSYDGGNTWLSTGMAWTPSDYYVATSMVINPQDTNRLVLTTNTGIFTSSNGGASFIGAAVGDFYQVLYNPADTNILYATSYWSYGSGGPVSAQIWRSTNAGATWTQQTNLSSDLRVTLAVTPAAPNMVMAISAALGTPPDYMNYGGLDTVYKSWDTGGTYTAIYAGGCSGGNLLTWDPGGNSCGGQGWYTLPLAISPVDTNIVYTGGVNTWGSSNGGYTWTLVNQEDASSYDAAIVHADQHWLAFQPQRPGRLFETNDGGVVYSDNPVGSGVWNFITNRMGIEEIYRMATSNVASYTLSGAQDVGDKEETAAGVYEEAYNGSDGMTAQMDFVDSTVGYVSGQVGYIYILDPTNPVPYSTVMDISQNIPPLPTGGPVEGTADWTTPFVLEPSCHTCILAGYQNLYLSSNKGNTWSQISNFQSLYDIYRIATCVSDPNTIYASQDDYGDSIYCTHNGGATWSVITIPGGGYNNITDIAVDPADSSHLWLTYGGYSSQKVASYRPSTGFTYPNTGLPDVPILCIAIDSISGDKYVGTEIGVYYMDTTMTAWAPYTTGLPSVEVTDLQINYANNELWAATYGRSLWKSPKHTTTVLPNSVATIVPYAPDGIVITPNPNHGSFTVTVNGLKSGGVTMRLLSSNGRTAWKEDGTVNGNKINIQATGLAPGTYIFDMSSGDEIIGKQKVVIY